MYPKASSAHSPGKSTNGSLPVMLNKSWPFLRCGEFSANFQAKTQANFFSIESGPRISPLNNMATCPSTPSSCRGIPRDHRGGTLCLGLSSAASPRSRSVRRTRTTRNYRPMAIGAFLNNDQELSSLDIIITDLHTCNSSQILCATSVLELI